MIPGKLDLRIYAGATFRRVISLKDSAGTAIDLTGAVARMQIRETLTSTAIIIELNDTNGRAVVTNGVGGEVTLMIADEDTALLTFASAVYDLEVEYSDGTVDRVLEGKVKVSPEVTR